MTHSATFNPRRSLPYLAAVAQIIPGWTDTLIYSGALANIALWIRAGEMVDGTNFWGRVSSVSLGIALSLGPVQIIQKWAGMLPTIERKKRGEYSEHPNPRYWLAVGAFIVILAFETVLLAPVVLAMMNGDTLPETLGNFALLWSFGRVLISAVVIGGLAAVMGERTKHNEKQPALLTKLPKAEPKQAEAEVKQIAPLCYCLQCDWTSLEAEKLGKDPIKALSGHTFPPCPPDGFSPVTPVSAG